MLEGAFMCSDQPSRRRFQSFDPDKVNFAFQSFGNTEMDSGWLCITAEHPSRKRVYRPARRPDQRTVEARLQRTASPQQFAVPHTGGVRSVSRELIQRWSGARTSNAGPLPHTPSPLCHILRGEENAEKVSLSLE